MPLTPNSSTAPYCTGTQFTVIFDWRTAADLLSDIDASLTNAAAVAASAVLLEMLMEGAGQIEMATSIGNRYQPADLTTLAASGTAMGSRIARLNAAITMEYCWRRRPDKEMPAMPEFEEASLMLKSLSEGELVFGFVESMNAGVLQDYVETPFDVAARNMPSKIAQNMFGRRSNRVYNPLRGQ